MKLEHINVVFKNKCVLDMTLTCICLRGSISGHRRITEHPIHYHNFEEHSDIVV